ncbi:jg12467 [Pararge aegeria aegeria]|uniref:Jg12467 protein n=1 Tax=Pararge aegeria aegeria TaxID=348720 RepID=A0A8S4RRS5_9NEOP|nr:jg12467 [Pararge aegeria aegeria]
MRSANDKNKEETVIVDTKFGHFREHEIDAKLKEAEQAPLKVGDGGEVLDTKVNVEKIEKPQVEYGVNDFSFRIATMAVNYFWACSAWARVKPHNIIGLVLGVPALSCLIAGFAALWEIQLHLMLAIIGLTVAIVICLLLALTPWDFTTWFLYLVVILFGSSAIILALICYLFVGYTFIFAKLHYLLIATTIIFILLVTELRLLLSGRYIEILEDDHALAAWLLYASTFTFILKLVQTFDLVDTD